MLGLIFFDVWVGRILALPPTSVAGQFFGALFASHYYVVISLLQVVPAVLLPVNRCVALGVVILAPIIVNILFFHALIAPVGLPLALVVAVLWFLVA